MSLMHVRIAVHKISQCTSPRLPAGEATMRWTILARTPATKRAAKTRPEARTRRATAELRYAKMGTHRFSFSAADLTMNIGFLYKVLTSKITIHSIGIVRQTLR